MRKIVQAKCPFEQGVFLMASMETDSARVPGAESKKFNHAYG
jgi:hypothetical protein